MNVPCTHCGNPINVLQALEDKDARRWGALVMQEVPPGLHAPLYRYLQQLFKPPKQILRWSRMYTLTADLVEPIKRARIERNNQVHVVPLELWVEALTELVESPPPSLRLPRKGHGYLIEMLASRAEKVAAKAEQAREDERRRGASSDEVARKGLQSIQEALNGK